MEFLDIYDRQGLWFKLFQKQVENENHVDVTTYFISPEFLHDIHWRSKVKFRE